MVNTHTDSPSGVDQYAVFGNPIAHSKSPRIHTEFAEQTGQQLQYTKQLVAEDKFAEAARAFFNNGGRGLNITVPFKLDAYSFADQLTARAECAGAVNTLALQADGSILGDNTDGCGMVSDITEHLGWSIRNKRVLILGAGGAVRGVLQPLLSQQPAQLVIANRTLTKAIELVQRFENIGLVTACAFSDLSGQQFDLVINGTSASLSGQLPPLPDDLLSADAACYDMMYGAEPTVFLQWAKDHGCKHSADGLGMLVGQAAESFAWWRGVRPAVEPVIAQLRREM